MRFDQRVEAASLSDAELVARCRVGDDDAWRALVERFSRYVYAIAVQAYRLSDADAEDVFQDVFTRVYERLGQLRKDEAIRPWIAQLTRRTCIDRIRNSGRVEPAEEVETRDVDETLDGLEEAWAVRELVSELSGNCQEILDRFFARDESYRTIGEALDLPAGTIASRISRCLGKLKGQLEGRKPRFQPSGDRNESQIG
jgi:RNA polymerase sigma factor (sigma-70 family)